MAFYAPPIARLLEELERLPGIGPKSAQRLAYHILRGDDDAAGRLADAIVDVKRTIRFCERCFNFAEGDLCDICGDPGRDTATICVVEEPRDVVAVERTGEFRGTYHVLQGAISPIDGIGPEQLRVRELVDRLRAGDVTEVILATDPDIEGETTALYLSRLIRPLGVRVTRIASGLPVGGDLEYADEVTLGRALEARREMD
ncbi:MAG TPA: recombination protein RecR [Coriobacteriia bacterium]|jgi:recombination protein RecR|uniref:recombination mediator RecR n=1 Tax=Anaerosoma tenue TaxID=2933588 RepID=UPI00076D6029|nr:recombination mediator RecR [Anaerosoma tenue]KUK49052.1 MAG: Recombination protein RecR [Actinobacteria bacterium 66_15]MCK8115831.1 recombination mediator RecR [Anaerosoma tenue]HAL30782.1 recombination protein RecR [Coriobacteriia bacterium]HHJ98986.1 recombination protein RecR [Actinomycetota bacterium]